jgi:hypothetical protein
MKRKKWGFNHMSDDDAAALDCDSGAFPCCQVIVRAQPK